MTKTAKSIKKPVKSKKLKSSGVAANPKKSAAAKEPKTKTPRTKRVGPSRRAQQRLIALNMGLEKKGQIPADDLREACRKAGLDKSATWGANFTQDMKKDSTLFDVVEKDGRRVGWKLTEAGKKTAKAVAKQAAN